MRRILLALVLSAQAYGVQEFYSLTRSVRAMGMGGAFYSLSNDESALFYNPTGMALITEKGFHFAVRTGGTVSTPPTAIGSVIESASNAGTIGALANATSGSHGSPIHGGGQVVAFHVRRAYGIAMLADAKINVVRTGSTASPDLDVTQIIDSGIVFGLAHRFSSKLFMGLNTKLLYRSGGHANFRGVTAANRTGYTLAGISGTGSGLGIDADLGVTYQVGRVGPIQRLGFSFVISNLLATTFPWVRGEGPPPGLPLTLSAGLYASFKSKLMAAPFTIRLEGAEYQTGGNLDPDSGARVGAGLKFLRAGVELPFLTWWTLRAGLYHGSWTVGTTVDFNSVKLDFASYSEELGGAIGERPQRRLALQMVFGFPVKGVLP